MKNYENDARRNSELGRFEIVCELYINGNDEQRRIILNALNEEERKTFLQGAGLYRLLTDERYYNAVRNAVGEQVYAELRG